MTGGNFSLRKSLIQLRDIIRKPQLERATRLIIRQRQEFRLEGLALTVVISRQEVGHVLSQQGGGGIEIIPQGRFCEIEGVLREEPDALGERVDGRRQRLSRRVEFVKEAYRGARGPVEPLGREEVFERPAFVDQQTEEQLAAPAHRETEPVLEEARVRLRSREPHVHLQGEFVPAADVVAVDFGDEGGRGDVEQQGRKVRIFYR